MHFAERKQAYALRDLRRPKRASTVPLRLPATGSRQGDADAARIDGDTFGYFGMRDNASIRLDEDVRLMMRTQGGDRQAYGRLYEKHVSAVRRYIARRAGPLESQEDMVQEVFARVWEHRDRYRPGMAVGPYLLGFAKNVHRELRLLTYRAIPVEPPEPDQVADSLNPGPEVVARRNDQVERVKLHLAELPPKQRLALELVYLRGLSSTEVSRLVGCSDRTIRTNCRLALQKLRQLVRDKRINE